jgi:hypothetical protein
LFFVVFFFAVKSPVTRRREIRKLCENFAACEKSAILDEIIGPVNSCLQPHAALTDSTLSEQTARGAAGEDPAWHPCEMPPKHYDSYYRQQKRYIEDQVMILVAGIVSRTYW